MLREAPGVRLDIPEIGYLLLIRCENLTPSPVPPEPEPEPEIEPSESEPERELSPSNILESTQSNVVSQTQKPQRRIDFFGLRLELMEDMKKCFLGEPKKLRRFVESFNRGDLDYEQLALPSTQKNKQANDEKSKRDSPSDKIEALINKFHDSGELQSLKNALQDI